MHRETWGLDVFVEDFEKTDFMELTLAVTAIKLNFKSSLHEVPSNGSS